MTSFFPTIQLHQAATDTPDREIIRILCDYITGLEDDGHIPHDRHVIDFLQESLERGPMDIPIAPWRSPLFTDKERSSMLELTMEDIRGSLKHYAEGILDDAELVEVIGYACPDTEAYGLQEFVEMLCHLGSQEPESAYIDGDFLRNHDDDGDDYAGQLDFAKRMGLIDETETKLTDRGIEFIEFHQ